MIAMGWKGLNYIGNRRKTKSKLGFVRTSQK